MAFQVRLLSEVEHGKIFPIRGTIFQLGGAPNAAISLPGQKLPEVVVQFQVTADGCRGTCHARDIVRHHGTLLSVEGQSFLWRVEEELLVGESRLVLEQLSTNRASTPPLRHSSGSSATSLVPPPIVPPVPLLVTEATSKKTQRRPEESNLTLKILLGILGAVVVGFAILLLAFGLDKQENATKSYSFQQVYAIAKSEEMSPTFIRMLSEANLNEMRNPRHALDNYVHLQRDLLAELESRHPPELRHPSSYGEKGKILSFLNQSVGRMKRRMANPDR